MRGVATRKIVSEGDGHASRRDLRKDTFRKGGRGVFRVCGGEIRVSFGQRTNFSKGGLRRGGGGGGGLWIVAKLVF